MSIDFGPVSTPAPLAVGDVVLDSYANAAVVVRVEMPGTRFVRYSVMQTCGSDRGRIGSAPTRLLPVLDPAVVEAAREVARVESRRLGLRWGPHGIICPTPRPVGS